MTEEEVDRLKRRLARERAAREESEQIAEEATRTLFDRRREVELLGMVASAANATEDAAVALEHVLAAVCTHTGWPVGHAYLLHAGRMTSSGVWVMSDPDRFAGFRERTAELSFRSGEGIPGQVLADGRPLWVADVAQDPDFVRADVARAAGLRGAFAFPLLVGSEVVGVLEFFSAESRPPDRVLLALMAQVGTQAGRVVERARAREELERSNADLEQFGYRISHDLQEPLRTITAFAELLERRHADQLDGDAREFLDFVTGGARRMQEMVAGLLQFSRAGSFDPGDEEVDTGALVRQVLAGLHARVAETKAWVDVAEDLPTVRGSGTGLGQVFQNLLENAMKFTVEGATPAVQVRAQALPREWVFTIADQGIGIDPDHRERVFDVFERLHTRDEFAGSGIGLAVTRRIVERHGGRLWVEDNPPRGSAFHFSLPR